MWGQQYACDDKKASSWAAENETSWLQLLEDLWVALQTMKPFRMT
jgi:hypothetical protein